MRPAKFPIIPLHANLRYFQLIKDQIRSEQLQIIYFLLILPLPNLAKTSLEILEFFLENLRISSVFEVLVVKGSHDCVALK